MRATIRVPFLLLFLAFGATGLNAQSTEIIRETPDTFRITSAYPNPFNPHTQFTVVVEQTQHMMVEVFNLVGHRVALLHDGLLSADKPHTFTFDAGDLPSGLYLIRVTGDQAIRTQRVTLLK